MRHRTTVGLFILFMTGICVLWWAERVEIPTFRQRQQRYDRLLPELIDTPVSEIKRVEIDRRTGPRKDRLRAARVGGSWQLVEPIDTAADPELVETLVRNLKDLRRSDVAGTIEGDPEPYGLKEPEAVVKVFVDGKTDALATIALGKATKERGYVRVGNETGIEVVDPKPLGAATLPWIAWRDKALIRVPSFRVKDVKVRETKPDVTTEIERDDRNWRLVSPIRAPADNDKAEGLVAELSALRVPEGGNGFVADDVPDRDRAAFGLDAPSMTITVTPFESSGKPQTLLLGKAVPGKPDEVYAMRGDQDDVVRLDVKRLREAMPGPNGLRSQTVLDLSPSHVDRVRIETRGTVYDLAKSRTGWTFLSPAPGGADTASVQTLLTRLGELKASEFLDPSRVPDPGLDPPAFRLRGWQPAAVVAPPTAAASGPPRGEPRFDLSLGRHDGLRNTVYGRIAGDTSLLALPDSILKVLPQNAFAFRDRTILNLDPTRFASVTVERERSSVTVEAPPKTGATGMHWKMVEPVAAPADEAAVTSLLLALGNLRAESWVSDRVGDGKAFGLDAPWLRVKWTLHTGAESPMAPSSGGKRGVLRLGKVKPGGISVYGNVEGDGRVFTLIPGAVVYLEAELHAQKVMGFKPDDAERVVFLWPSRTLAFDKNERPPGVPPVWEVTPGYDPTGFDASRVGPIVAALADLATPRFLQYAGPLAGETGLASPRVTVKVKVAGKADELTLRVGRSINETTFVATNVAGDRGPSFVLPAGPWNEVLKPPRRPDDLPDDLFVPDTPPPVPKADVPVPAPGT